MWIRKQNPYPYATSFRLYNCNGGTINLHCDHADIRHPAVSSVLVFSKDLKGLECIICCTVFSNDVGAGTHEVKTSLIKGRVVGVSHGPACSGLIGDYWLNYRKNSNTLFIVIFLGSMGLFF